MLVISLVEILVGDIAELFATEVEIKTFCVVVDVVSGTNVDELNDAVVIQKFADVEYVVVDELPESVVLSKVKNTDVVVVNEVSMFV